jgi:hypothetical protein
MCTLFWIGVSVLELYYWCWWLPRNWEKTREAEDIKAIKSLYGKDGTVWQMTKKGDL